MNVPGPSSRSGPSSPEDMESRLKMSAEDHARYELLIDTGLLLANTRDLETLTQSALDAARQLTCAAFAAFVYDTHSPDDGPGQRLKLSAEDPSILPSAATPPLLLTIPHSASLDTIERTADLHDNSRFAGVSPFRGTPFANHPIRSYLSVPVRSRDGNSFGVMLFGDAKPNIFDLRAESLASIVAAQAAAAIDNAHLAETLSHEIALADSARQLQRETAERLAAVFESMTDGVAMMNRDWRFTYLNRRANDIVAQGRNLVGMHYYEVFPDAPGSVFEQHYAEAMNDGLTVEFTDFYAPLDIWACVRVFPTPDGIAIFFQDVTLQRRAERERDDTATRLRQALDAGGLGTWTWNRATDMLDLDERAAELFFTEPHVPISRSVLRERIVVEEDVDTTIDQLRKALESNGQYSAEYRVEAADGRQTWIASRGLSTFDPTTNELTGMIGTIQDITTRKTQEAALRQSEKLAATGRLAATIAHEINNPLEAVTNLIYLSKTDPAVPPPIQHLLETADNELARVAQIAQQTLGFYRDTTRLVDINITDLLDGVVNLFSRKMQYRKLKCELDLEPDLHITGLQGEVRQVFSNLLVNAIDASTKGIICVRARKRTRHGVPGVSVLVSDQGSGIPVNVRQRLFSPFFTTKESIGTGLGLWVTRGIVEKQGGTIRFRTSSQPPTGTVFNVFLPTQFLHPATFDPPKSAFLQ